MRSLGLPHLLILAAMGSLTACGSKITNPNPNTDGDNGGDDTAAEAADIDFSVTSIDFGDMHQGDRENSAITVYNRGSGTLDVTSVTVGAPFIATPSMFTVSPGGSSTVTITGAADSYGDFVDDVEFVSNDPDEPTAVVSLHLFTISDEDGDGHDTPEAGGDDCDDEDASVYPGATETWYDDVDEDCSGGSDWDQDGDGYEADTHNPDPATGGGDCQDVNVEYNPGAADEPYDNRDTNCDGADDFDYDGDGYRSDDYGAGTDCDDFDPDANAEGIETFDGKDDDCDGMIDEDAEASGSEWVYDAGGTRDRAGFSVAMGDLDGDGYADLVMAGPYVDATTNNTPGRGGVGVFYGGTDLESNGTDFDNGDVYFEGDTTSDLMGYGLAVVGDYNGDGVNDLAAAAPGAASNAGVVYLFSGAQIDRVSDTTDALLSLNGPTSGSLGRGLGTDIDLDGDGLQDLVSCYATGGMNALAISYGGSMTGNADAADGVLLTTDGTGTAFYRNAPVGGDLDGDGYDDLVTSDGYADYSSLTDNGVAWAVWGGPSRMSLTGAVDIETVGTVLLSGPTASAGYAWAVELTPDTTGDGAGELWVYNHGEGLYLLEGAPGRRGAYDLSTESVAFYQWHENSSDVETLSQAGDWTGDGVGDVLVFQTDASGGYGENELFSGSMRGATSERSGRIAEIVGTSDASNGNVGYGTAPVNMDYDADGKADVVMGDPEFDTVKGKIYVFKNDSE